MIYIIILARILFVFATFMLCVASVGVLYHHNEIEPNKGTNILFATVACLGVIASWGRRRRVRRNTKADIYLPITDLGNLGAWRNQGEL